MDINVKIVTLYKTCWVFEGWQQNWVAASNVITTLIMFTYSDIWGFDSNIQQLSQTIMVFFFFFFFSGLHISGVE
jgi:hypothetical protein